MNNPGQVATCVFLSQTVNVIDLSKKSPSPGGRGWLKSMTLPKQIQKNDKARADEEGK